MIVAGVDEVGRGPIAGPLLVVAAAFEIQGWDLESPPTCPVKGVRDSKAFGSRRSRESVALAIRATETFLGQGRGIVAAPDITERGMGWALKSSFARAISSLPVVPDLIFVDGNAGIPDWPGKQLFGPKGDSRWWPVSAASILAKVERDKWMDELDLTYPGYGWARNSGYGTKEHFEAIRTLGLTPVHRLNFVRSFQAKSREISNIDNSNVE